VGRPRERGEWWYSEDKPDGRGGEEEVEEVEIGGGSKSRVKTIKAVGIDQKMMSHKMR
jgi:hypothetical protein